jgi:membrane protease YdiL (CAAX protease family)
VIIFALLVVVSWTLAAFGEEMVYRAYLLNRMADLFGDTKRGWVIGVLLSTSLFAFAHLDQGISGVLENWLVGALLASLYLLTKRNLWLPVFMHGFADTIGFTIIFLGLYP